VPAWDANKEMIPPNHRIFMIQFNSFSCGSDTRRTGHGPGACRCADSICGTGICSEAALLFVASLCSIGYRGVLLEHSFQPFALIALTALAMGARNAAVRTLAIPDLTTTVLTLTITGIGADSSLANGNNPRLARRVASVAALFLGAALGTVVIHYSTSATLWLATTIWPYAVLCCFGLCARPITQCREYPIKFACFS
jgi:hypothetical protein